MLLCKPEIFDTLFVVSYVNIKKEETRKKKEEKVEVGRSGRSTKKYRWRRYAVARVANMGNLGSKKVETMKALIHPRERREDQKPAGFVRQDRKRETLYLRILDRDNKW